VELVDGMRDYDDLASTTEAKTPGERVRTIAESIRNAPDLVAEVFSNITVARERAGNGTN
jgi:hypothetical protein